MLQYLHDALVAHRAGLPSPKLIPLSFSPETNYLKSEDGKRIVKRLTKLETEPINLTHFNQLLHLNHKA